MFFWGATLSWQNDDLVLFHGCTDQSIRPANPKGINLGALPHGVSHKIGAARPDFGHGFYATTWLDQAMNWANIRVRKLAKKHPKAKAIVLRFSIKRDDLAKLEDLVFVSDRASYFAFVGYCRNGGVPHAPAANRSKPYDVVFGPVSLIGQSHTISGSDQVSFHTQIATSKISAVSVEAIGNPLFAKAIP